VWVVKVAALTDVLFAFIFEIGCFESQYTHIPIKKKSYVFCMLHQIIYSQMLFQQKGIFCFSHGGLFFFDISPPSPMNQKNPFDLI
jgi:hypothetical protein